MDNLEKYIRSHREDFDVRNPDPALWNAIEQRIPQKTARRISIWKITSVAAVGLVLVLSGVIAGLRMNSSGVMPSAEYTEFRQAEQYYNAQLQERVAALNAYDADDDILNDLDELQSVYNELSAELEDGFAPNQNDLLQALIQNYQTRINLLERVLTRLEEGQNQTELNTDDEENIIY